MSEKVKNDNEKDDKKENSKESKKTEKSAPTRHVDFAKGLVVLDNIRKEINKRDGELEKIRGRRYDYLNGEYLKKILAEECAIAGIPIDTFEKKLPNFWNEKSPIELKSSPLPVPRTSSGIIGWRSSRRECNLEYVGAFHVSARKSIEPPLIEGEFRVTEQKYIFLG